MLVLALCRVESVLLLLFYTVIPAHLRVVRVVLLHAFIRFCAAEDVEGHVVTKTTKIVQKTAPEEGSFLALILVFFRTLSLAACSAEQH